MHAYTYTYSPLNFCRGETLGTRLDLTLSTVNDYICMPVATHRNYKINCPTAVSNTVYVPMHVCEMK